jgi:uncharacterized protein YyaL (SSP411 family)
MNQVATNNLSSARSAYLRTAMHQPIQWMEWSSEAFAKAQREDKPILLDIGAVWCHWCHVMDRESYENPETARIVNEHFIAIKVDRDERPDVDSRYQAAVAAISGQGGWPLTAFLTPDGRPYFGGTYFPPLDQHGRPGLRRVLMTMAEAFQQRRDEVLDSAGSVMAAIEHNESFDGSAPDPGAELLDKIIQSTLQQFDRRFGGFGSQPKFPNSGAIDLLLDEAGRGHGDTAKAARLAALATLEKMSRGGIYDHLAGGFHRYSVDERWVVPHFEKMSYDNSELLKNFVHAFQSSGESECARIARETMHWIDEWLSDRVLGGFYASQDADDSLDDDGDYFTWTREEAAAVLSPIELTVAGEFFDIGEIGDMHHNPLKNTLHIDQPLATIANKAGISLEEAANVIHTAKARLYAARKLRKTPYVDQTIYVGWNSMMISAYLEASRVLRDEAAKAFALKSLDRVLAQVSEGSRLGHVVAYSEGHTGGPQVPAVLEDFVFTAHAALDAWEITGEFRYFESALQLAQTAVANFYDQDRGGFFDTDIHGADKIGALTARRKPLQDSPTPAGNPVAAALLIRLEALTARAEFGVMAKETLECFAAIVEHFGLYAASYGLALRRLISPPVQVVVVGLDSAADALELAALQTFAIEKSVIRLRRIGGDLPPTLLETLAHLPQQPGSFAVVCSGYTCGLPLLSVDALRQALAPVLPDGPAARGAGVHTPS